MKSIYVSEVSFKVSYVGVMYTDVCLVNLVYVIEIKYITHFGFSFILLLFMERKILEISHS